MSDDPTNLSRDARAIWDQNADAWDAYMGEGRLFSANCWGLRPNDSSIFNRGKQCSILRVAMARSLVGWLNSARPSWRVTSVRCFSKRAKARTVEHVDRIEYRLIDATDEAQLLTLGKRRFDAAVCTMGIMDMAAIDPLFAALSRLLKPGGCFVFSVMHPCFNNGEPMVAEQIDSEQGIEIIFAVKISHYLTLRATKGWGIASQPTAQYYFHRPLHVLFDAAFRVGFVLDGLEEPAFKQAHESRRTFNWTDYSEIPPALVARLRLT